MPTVHGTHGPLGDSDKDHLARVQVRTPAERFPMTRRTAVWVVGLGVFLATHAHGAALGTGVTSQLSPEGVVPVKLGTVDFEISCVPRVTADFNRGVALLHSFWHDQAFLASRTLHLQIRIAPSRIGEKR